MCSNSNKCGFFHSGLKKSIIGIFILSLTALCLCSIAFLMKRYESDQLWNISLAVFSLLGVLLTAGTAVPVISGILSYQQFTKESERAEKKLAELEDKRKKLEEDIHNKLPLLEKQSQQIESILNKEKQRELIYRYITNKKLTNQDKDCINETLEILSWKKYECNIYQLIAIKQWEIKRYEGEIESEKVQYDKPKDKDYQHKLDILELELFELFEFSRLFDQDLKQIYFECLYSFLTHLNKRLEKEEDKKEIEYLEWIIKRVLMKFILFNENNFNVISISEEWFEKVKNNIEKLFTDEELENLTNPNPLSKNKLINRVKGKL